MWWGAALMFGASWSTALAQLAFKRATGGRRAMALIGVGVGLYAASLVLMVGAYRLGDLTQLTPLLSLSIAWTVLLAVRWLGERMTRRRWLGVALILIGSMWLVR